MVFAIVILSVAGCKNETDHSKVSSADSTTAIYTCPMHPQVIEHHPGNCPICGMALVKKENANREISQVDLSTLLQPTNSIVVSSIPVAALQHSDQQVQLEALGRFEYDTRFVKTIAARISGRIENCTLNTAISIFTKGTR